ncbi:MAG: glycosyltransferase [Candidatus Riflebacteria bacterium]|nr:glycosyltransferase [Candidatus Riflebacteria bacterium]
MPRNRVRITPPRLILFAKVPLKGQVKTRIAQSVGKGRATEICRAMLSGFIARLRSLKRKWQVELHFTPRDQEALLAPDVPPWLIRVPQVEGDLGARMAAAFANAFACRTESRDEPSGRFNRGPRGAHGSRQADRNAPVPCIICGTDIPDMPVTHILEAREKLTTCDLVVGPGTDGGYYLIGLRRPVPQLFENIPWSTPDVLSITMERARALNLVCHTLPAWTDIDTMEDVQAFLDRPPLDVRVGRIQSRIRATLQGVESPRPHLVEASA